MVLSSLEFWGYDVTDVYFFGHCKVLPGTSKTIEGLDFGDQCWNKTALENFCKGTLAKYTDKGTEIHFRHCYVGAAENQELFKNLAKWSGRTCTGVDGTVNMSSKEKKNADGTDKPDYEFMGNLMQTKPGEQPTIAWQRIIESWEGNRINPNQPY